MSQSLVGNLLVASSLVNDPVLSKAVCLVVHEDENGFIGVMLNRPIQPNPNAMMQMMANAEAEEPESVGRLAPEDFEIDEEYETEEIAQHTLATASQAIGQVHFGGPNNGPVVAIHGSSEFAEAETAHGIYVAAQKPNLEALVQNQSAPYRLIVGHIGWSPEQLLAEVDAGYWHIIPATTDAVFSQDLEMWPRLIHRATSNSVARWLGIPDAPMANELN